MVYVGPRVGAHICLNLGVGLDRILHHTAKCLRVVARLPLAIYLLGGRSSLAILLAAMHQLMLLLAAMHQLMLFQAAVGILNKGTTKNGFIMNLLRSLFWLSAKFNFRITAQFIEGKKNVIADALSRMHVAFYLLRAFHYLCSQSTLWQVNSEFLMCHMPYASFLFLLSRYSGYKPGC